VRLGKLLKRAVADEYPRQDPSSGTQNPSSSEISKKVTSANLFVLRLGTQIVVNKELADIEQLLSSLTHCIGFD